MDGIEHTDSYRLQLQRNKEEEAIAVVDAEDSLTSLSYVQDKQLEADSTPSAMEQTFNLMQQVEKEQDDVQTASSDVTETGREDANTVDAEERSVSPEVVTAQEEEEDSESIAAEMLVAERSTASDIVSQAMAKAVERTATPV